MSAPRTGVFRTMWRLADRESRALIAQVLAWRAAQSVCAGLPVLAAVLVAQALIDDGVDLTLAWQVTALCAVSLTGHWICAVRANKVGWPGAMRVVGQIRADAVERLRRLPVATIGRRRTGDLLSTLTTDTAVLESYLVLTLPNLAGAVTFPLVAVVVLVLTEPLLGAAVLATMLLALPIWSWAMRRFGSLARERQDAQAATTAAILEYLRGQAALRSFAGLAAAQARLGEQIDQGRDLHTRLATRLTPPMLVFSAVLELGLPLLLLAMAWSDSTPGADAAAFALFGIVVLRIYSPLLTAAGEGETLRLARASLDRLELILLVEPQSEPQQPEEPRGHDIELDGVRLRYPGAGRDALDGVDLCCTAGTTTALVGPSGAGKTSVLGVIARFWDVTEGVVRIGGVDVRDLTAEERYRLVAVVFQDSQLVSGTIAENIMMARPDAVENEMILAAQAARVHEFVATLPHGYDTQVGEAGSALSGGQRQRVCLARAFLKDAPILLLDEYTSSLDATTEVAVREAIEVLRAGRTVVVVGHRASTIRGADQIVVIERGRAIEGGTHTELLARGGSYARTWRERSAAQDWRLGAPTSSGSEA